MASAANLTIYQGDDYAAIVTVSNGTTPPDLTGYLAQAQIRKGPADLNPVILEMDTVVVLSPPQINLSISHDLTLLLSGQYVWDLQLIAPEGSIYTILAGKVFVTPEVTRE